MKKLLLQVLISACIAFPGSLHAGVLCAPPPASPWQEEEETLSMTVSENTVRIRNAAAGAKLEIYNVLGLKVQSIKIDTANKTVALSLPKGCYILKLENIVRKIAIK